MRRAIGLVAVSIMLCGSAANAQVINGEGDYEGSSLHTPPPQTDTDNGPGAVGGRKSAETKRPRQDEGK